jgi:hypothetical protein
LPVPTPTEPAFVCVFAPSGVGKTTDMGFSFPRALFVAQQGALKPVPKNCGYDPSHQTRRAETIADASKLVPVAEKAGCDAIIFDDFSFLAEQTYNYYGKKFARSSNKFAVPNAVRQDLIEFRKVCRNAGIHCAMNCWLQGPKLRNGVMMKGGPKLPGGMPEQIPAMCDLVLMGGFNQARKPWPGVYFCYPSADYCMKDRDVEGWRMPREMPMNLGEILRFNGYAINRHPGLDWQEETVAKIADALAASDPMDQAEIGRSAFAQLTAKGYGAKHIVWTLRDAVDRATLHRSQVSVLDAFGWS